MNVIDFGGQVQIDFEPGTPQAISIRTGGVDLPEERPERGTALLGKSSVRLVARTRGSDADDRIDVTFAVASVGAPACDTGTTIGTFTLVLNDAGDDFTIEPAFVDLPDAAFDLLLSDELQMCVRAEATFAGRIEIDGLHLEFELPSPDVQDREDLASARIIVNGQVLARFETGDADAYISVGIVPRSMSSNFGGFVQIAFSRGLGSQDQSQIFIIFDDAAELDGQGIAVTEFSGVVQVLTAPDGPSAGAGGRFCNNFEGLLTACDTIDTANPSGTIRLRRSDGRITGTFSFTLGDPPANAVGEVDLPEFFRGGGPEVSSALGSSGVGQAQFTSPTCSDCHDPSGVGGPIAISADVSDFATAMGVSTRMDEVPEHAGLVAVLSSASYEDLAAFFVTLP